MAKLKRFYNIFFITAFISSSFFTSSKVLASPERLSTAAESMASNWNAVAPKHDGTFFASAPRWTGSQGFQLTYIDKNSKKHPYPDKEWNSWKEGDTTQGKFVNINAIRIIGNQLWVVDTGSPEFGGTPLTSGAKLVLIDLDTNKVIKKYFFDSSIAGKNSYVDDVRVHSDYAYLTDAGWPGIIVLNLQTGEARRVLNNSTSTLASATVIKVNGDIAKAPDGQPLKVNSDPLELSPNGQWLYFGPLNGPMYKVETKYLTDSSLVDSDLEQQGLRTSKG